MRAALLPVLCILCISGSLFAHTISINDVVVTEKDSGTTLATFTIGLSAPGTGDDSVTYFTADATALANSDYTPTLQNLIIPLGTLSKTVTITVLSDDIPELSEVFFVRLTNSTAPILDGEGQCTILDDDSDSPGISIDSIFLTEGDSGTTEAILTVSLSGSPGADVTVDYITQEGTANTTDYMPDANVIMIPNGQTSATVTIPIVGDTDAETNEFFFVNLSNSTNATIVQGQGTVIIIDNEGTYLFSALFNDGTLDPNWSFGSGWSEDISGNLVGISIKKTRAIATPVFAGCTQCSILASIRTSGGSGNKISLLGWYFDKKNNMEIMMKEEADKWIIKVKQNGDIVIKEKLLLPILPNTDYQWFVFYDGSRLLLFLDGVLMRVLNPQFTPQGTFGFQVKAATGTFPDMTIN